MNGFVSSSRALNETGLLLFFFLAYSVQIYFFLTV